MPTTNVWFSVHDQQWRDTVTGYMKTWLPGPPCLTRAFKQFYAAVTVRILDQKIKHIPLSIKKLLNIEDQQGLIRQVYLIGDQQPLCYSQTIVPSSILKKHDAFLHLGDRALGETLLFNSPIIERSEFEISCLLPTTRLFQQALKHYPDTLPDQLWARRSIFQLETKPLLVTEVFLPTISQLSSHN